MSDVMHDSLWDKALVAWRRMTARLWDLPSDRVQTMAASLLVTFTAGIFGVALVITAIVVFAGELPAWLSDEIHRRVMIGNHSVELTIDYLTRWGIIDVLREMVTKMLLFGATLVGILALARFIMRTIRMRPWLLGAAMGKSTLPRIRLTRTLRVSVNDLGQGYQHQFDMHIDIVLGRPVDTHPVIGKLSTILPIMLKSTRDVIERANTDVKTDEIAYVLSRSARTCDKRIRRVEVRDVAYAIVHPTTGDVMFTQNLPVTPV